MIDNSSLFSPRVNICLILYINLKSIKSEQFMNRIILIIPQSIYFEFNIYISIPYNFSYISIGRTIQIGTEIDLSINGLVKLNPTIILIIEYIQTQFLSDIFQIRSSYSRTKKLFMLKSTVQIYMYLKLALLFNRSYLVTSPTSSIFPRELYNNTIIYYFMI